MSLLKPMRPCLNSLRSCVHDLPSVLQNPYNCDFKQYQTTANSLTAVYCSFALPDSFLQNHILFSSLHQAQKYVFVFLYSIFMLVY